MNSKKSKLSLTLIIILLQFVIIFPMIAEYLPENIENPFDYARITDVEYKAVVVDEPDQEGKVIITERLTFDIHAFSKNNLFWELWRDLPEQYVDGVKVDYKVNSVKQIFPDGNVQIYEQSPKLYWDDYDYVKENTTYGPGKWYHSEGPYNPDRQRYECVLFYVDGLYREEVVFEIEYEMRNAGLRYYDCSELYLSMYSGESIKHLDSYKAQILVPNEDMPATGNYKVQTYGTSSNSFPYKESETINPGYHTFYFDLDRSDLRFRPYNQYIEFVLLSFDEDAHIFTEHASINDYYDSYSLDEINRDMLEYKLKPLVFFIQKAFISLVLTALSLIILIYVFTTDKRLCKKYSFYRPEYTPEYYRDIPSDLDPAFAAGLVFSKHKSKNNSSAIYAAILLSLARKKYISLRQLDPDDMEIHLPHRTNNTDSTGLTQLEPLTHCESLYYNLLLRHASSSTITMSTFRNRVANDYNNTNSFAQNMNLAFSKMGVKHGYLQKSEYTEPQKVLKGMRTFFLVLAIIFLFVINPFSYFSRLDLAFGSYSLFGLICLLAAILLHCKMYKYILLTPLGEEEYAKWRGLYRFLNSNTLLDESTVIALPVWEKYLVYATAFGISEKVIKAIEIKCPHVEESPVLSNHYYHSHAFRSSTSRFHHSVRSGSYSGGAYGGSFGGSYGGGGYGGGGRGGGGGGGGH